MDWTSVLVPVARHSLTGIGGFLISHGLLQQSDLDAFIGAGMLLGGVVWSVWQKYGRVLVSKEIAQIKGLKTHGV